MSNSTAGNDPPTSRSPRDERADAAALAAKVASLPESRLTASGGERRAPQQHHLRRHGGLWWVCHAVVCIGVWILASIALLRIFFHDATNILTCVNAFSTYLYLPAYLALFWSVWYKRWLAALLSMAVIACHLVWVAPNFLRDRRFDLPPELTAEALASSTPLRIFFANVLTNNSAHDALLNEIVEFDPDVLVFAEFSGHWYRAFSDSPVLSTYSHSTSGMWNGAGLVIIYSKLPLNSPMQNWLGGRQVQTVDLKLGSQSLRLMGLHAPRPMPREGFDYRPYWEQLLMLLSVETGPLVVIGDFNATQHSLVYQRMKELGLRSAHEDRGRGYATTWPNGAWPLPPIRIDQAFLSAGVECDRVAEGRGAGSDHKPLIIDVRVRRRQQNAPSAAENGR